MPCRSAPKNSHIELKLHLFNPENDLALAAGTANYTPPKSVAAFRAALAAIPAWLAEPGDNIIAPGVTESWLREAGLEVGLRLEGIPEPWGWSANAVAQFRHIGVNGPFPDVERMRFLSHRRTALRLHAALQGKLPYVLPAAPIEITDISQLPDTDRIFLKSPWSCSGRGVIDCLGLSGENIKRRASDAIRRQGSVMVEPRLNKVRDFAMLFRSGKYLGLSLFETNGTAYTGNVVASQPELAAMLGAPHLLETAVAIEQWLPSLGYDGPLGVDMMLYESDGEMKICPTVEVNLRLTMGFVALALERRFGRGFFRIAPHRLDGISLIPANAHFSAALLPFD